MKSTNPVVNELLNLAAKLRAKRPQLEKRLSELDARIKAIETTVQLYAEEKKLGSVQRQRISADDLKDKTQLEALKRIAELNGGLVNASEAKRLFMTAGLSKSKGRNLAPHIYSILKNSPDFEWESPGTFRLTNGSHHQPALLRVQDTDA